MVFMDLRVEVDVVLEIGDDEHDIKLLSSSNPGKHEHTLNPEPETLQTCMQPPLLI